MQQTSSADVDFVVQVVDLLRQVPGILLLLSLPCMQRLSGLFQLFSQTLLWFADCLLSKIAWGVSLGTACVCC